MNQFTESGFHLAHFARVLFALTILAAAIAKANGQQDPASSARPMPFGISLEAAPSSQTQTVAQQTTPQANVLTRDEAVRLALVQASAFQSAKYFELIAA